MIDRAELEANIDRLREARRHAAATIAEAARLREEFVQRAAALDQRVHLARNREVRREAAEALAESRRIGEEWLRGIAAFGQPRLSDTRDDIRER